jgi:hypothetical protein
MNLLFLIHKISARRFEYLLTSFYVLIHVQDFLYYFYKIYKKII